MTSTTKTHSPLDSSAWRVDDGDSSDGRSRRAQAQRESRRAHILDTALQVFAQHGYHQCRVSDIIEAAGIARGTFYLYFESKNAIFLELLDGLLAHLRRNVVGVDTDAGAAPVEQQLLATVGRLLRTVASNRLLTTIIIREAVGLDEEVDRKLQEFYENLRTFIAEALTEGQRLGVIRALDTSMVAACVLGSIKSMLELYVMDPQLEVDVDRVGRAILDYNLYGLLNHAGTEPS